MVMPCLEHNHSVENIQEAESFPHGEFEHAQELLQFLLFVLSHSYKP